MAAAAPVPLLDLREVTVRFGGNVAVDRVSMHAVPGEIVGFVGPNDPTSDIGAELRDEVGWTGRRTLHDGLLSGESVELDLERVSRESGSAARQ